MNVPNDSATEPTTTLSTQCSMALMIYVLPNPFKKFLVFIA